MIVGQDGVRLRGPRDRQLGSLLVVLPRLYLNSPPTMNLLFKINYQSQD